MRRSLIHFWQIHLAVLLGAAVATAVLTGALLVGDSVRGSLRDLTLNRLGDIDHVMLSDRFFRETLAADLATSPETDDGYDRVVPAMLLSGSAVNATTKTRASRVQIQGIDERFHRFWSTTETDKFSELLKKGPGQLFPSVVINQSLKKELNVEVGGTLLISFQKRNEIHPEFLLGRRDTLDVLQPSDCPYRILSQIQVLDDSVCAHIKVFHSMPMFLSPFCKRPWIWRRKSTRF